MTTSVLKGNIDLGRNIPSSVCYMSRLATMEASLPRSTRSSTKRKQLSISESFTPTPLKKRQTTIKSTSNPPSPTKSPSPPAKLIRQPPQSDNDTHLLKSIHRISSHPSLTPYRRLVYRTLLSVPQGRWTTYAVLSAHLNSSARAIGNAMKTNPFAPDVPCHRVLASDRTIGGYKGDWGNGGSYAVEKTKLLRGEGISFDHRGRASGEIFREFVDLGCLLEEK